MYKEHLSKDKKFRKLLDNQEPLSLKKRKNLCNYLCASIMSQQLSTKVAKVIHNRFLDLYDGKEPSAEQIVNTPFEKLRAIGLSNAKVNYVKNVAQFEIESGLDIKKLSKLSDDEVIEYVTRIKGVGKWTAEMMLMFALGRQDVFSADDLGIQTAMINIYRLDNSDKKKFREEMLRISQKWAPFRTYACMHLWRWKDAVKFKSQKSKVKTL